METGAAPHKLCGWNPAQNEGPTVVRHAGRERSKETERERVLSQEEQPQWSIRLLRM